MASLILGISSSMASQLRSLSSTLQISNTRSLAGVPLHTSPSSISSVSISSTSTSSPIVLPMIYCGRGDRKTARGKRFSHSFGNGGSLVWRDLSPLGEFGEATGQEERKRSSKSSSSSWSSQKGPI
ncbi:ribosomal protein, variant 2 [Dionaea muscipula]